MYLFKLNTDLVSYANGNTHFAMGSSELEVIKGNMRSVENYDFWSLRKNGSVTLKTWQKIPPMMLAGYQFLSRISLQ